MTSRLTTGSKRTPNVCVCAKASARPALASAALWSQELQAGGNRKPGHAPAGTSQRHSHGKERQSNNKHRIYGTIMSKQCVRNICNMHNNFLKKQNDSEIMFNQGMS